MILLLLALLAQDRGTLTLTTRSKDSAVAWTAKGARVDLVLEALPSDDEIAKLAAKGIRVIVELHRKHDRVDDLCAKLDAGCCVDLCSCDLPPADVCRLGKRKGRARVCAAGYSADDVRAMAAAGVIVRLAKLAEVPAGAAAEVWSEDLKPEELRALGSNVTLVTERRSYFASHLKAAVKNGASIRFATNAYHVSDIKALAEAGRGRVLAIGNQYAVSEIKALLDGGIDVAITCERPERDVQAILER